MTRPSATIAAPSVRVEVPFLDLTSTLSNGIREAIVSDVAELLETHAYTNGPQVARFEEAFAGYVGTHDCVGVASGLDALRLALIARGIEPGDEVVVPANTFLATLEAVSQAGGRPVPADIQLSDYNLDPAAAEAAVTSRTCFLLPVHLYGLPADMRALLTVADRHGLGVLEDACQAHGAERDGLRAGGAGYAGAFSFYPAKNLGAIGDAGALVTDDAELAAGVRALREHGQLRKYDHAVEGYTARLDTIQAIALLRKLPALEAWNEERRAAARYYSGALAGVGDLRLPPDPPGARHVWHLYVVATPARAGLERFLADRGVSTGRHYPVPAHLTAAYAHLGYGRGSFPVAEQLADELLSLPLFPGISEGQLATVVEAVRDYFAHG